MNENDKRPSRESSSGPSIETWAKVGGAVGFVAMIALFGFGDSSGGPGPGTVFSGFIKGAIGGGIGAALFGGLAAVLGGRKK